MEGGIFGSGGRRKGGQGYYFVAQSLRGNDGHFIAGTFVNFEVER